MARKVRCRSTGEYGTNETFYKVIENGKNKYYKNKDVYEKHIEEKENREKLLDFISDKILNYKCEQPLPPILLKRIKELSKFYEYEVILETFRSCRDNLEYWMNLEKKFNNEFSKIQYMMAIIKNSIVDVYKKVEYKKQRLQKQESHSLDIGMLNQSSKQNYKKANNKDISSFLEGDE